MKTGLLIGKRILQGIYGLHKLARVNPKQVVFLSRQESEPLDFLLLDKELKKIDPSIVSKFCCRTMKPGIMSKISYGFNMIGPQLHALATSKVAVIDSYSVPISILSHRKGGKDSLKVIQIWHAMGALKKFSKSIVGKKEGRSRELADAMGMHDNYDMILASSDESRRAFGEAFGYGDDAFIIGALPRTDLLKNEEYIAGKRVEVIERHPELKDKKVVLYAPTLRIQDDQRSQEIVKAKELIEEIEKLGEEYAVCISPHPVKKDHYKDRVIHDFSTFELLAVCDFFVTDYSAVVYEASAAGKPLFLYSYDLDSYENSRGFYLDYENEMPNTPVKNASEIAGQIKEYETDVEYRAKVDKGVKSFAEKYIKDRTGTNTAYLAERIIDLMKAN